MAGCFIIQAGGHHVPLSPQMKQPIAVIKFPAAGHLVIIAHPQEGISITSTPEHLATGGDSLDTKSAIATLDHLAAEKSKITVVLVKVIFLVSLGQAPDDDKPSPLLIAVLNRRLV
jgi:hypothetical protein